MHSFIQTDIAMYVKVMSLCNHLTTTNPYTTHRSDRTLNILEDFTNASLRDNAMSLFPFSIQRQSENGMQQVRLQNNYSIH